MMLRIVSLRKDHVPVATLEHRIRFVQPPRELGEVADPVGAPVRPAALEQDDEPRRPLRDVTHELASEPPDDRVIRVVEEMKVVEEARRLERVQSQERMDTA